MSFVAVSPSICFTRSYYYCRNFLLTRVFQDMFVQNCHQRREATKGCRMVNLFEEPSAKPVTTLCCTSQGTPEMNSHAQSATGHTFMGHGQLYSVTISFVASPLPPGGPSLDICTPAAHLVISPGCPRSSQQRRLGPTAANVSPPSGSLAGRDVSDHPGPSLSQLLSRTAVRSGEGQESGQERRGESPRRSGEERPVAAPVRRGEASRRAGQERIDQSPRRSGEDRPGSTNNG